MRIFSILLFCSLAVFSTGRGEEAPASAQQADFSPFTGKVTGNKVRLRSNPHLEAPVIKEASIDDCLLIVGEADEFYAVKPAKETKAYIFRTFVLDGAVEGSRVNVRLEPDIDSPVIAQLNTGDPAEGRISSKNSKWLEIEAPESARFYVAKEYVEKIGGPELFKKREARALRIKETLSKSAAKFAEEIEKSYPEIRLNEVIAALKTIRNDRDFPASAEQARLLLEKVQEGLLKKKLAYLEEQTENREKAALPEEQVENFPAPKTSRGPLSEKRPEELSSLPEKKREEQPAVTPKMHYWLPAEERLYQNWLKRQREPSPIGAFYTAQRERAVLLRGTVQPYYHAVRNRPGDYILLSSFNNLPCAYLYSTKIDLERVIGREVVLKAVERPNHNFAFPAYYVLEID